MLKILPVIVTAKSLLAVSSPSTVLTIVTFVVVIYFATRDMLPYGLISALVIVGEVEISLPELYQPIKVSPLNAEVVISKPLNEGITSDTLEDDTLPFSIELLLSSVKL